MSLLTKRSRVDGSSIRKKRKLSPPSDHNDSDASMADDGEEFAGIGDAAPSEADDDMEDEDEDEHVEGTDHPQGHGKQGILDGLRDMQDAAELYQSSSFKLQIDALLPNVRPKMSRAAPLERTLHALYALFNQLPSVPPQHPLEASKKMLKKKGIAVPYPNPLPTQETNWKVSFQKPTNVTLVGSWANKLSVKGKDETPYGVDLALEMPDDLFQEKDYSNYRFFHKRAFFIACIADALQSKQSKMDVDVMYTCLSEDPRLTILELRPRKGSESYDFSGINAHIRIIPMLSPTSPMPLHRLSPLSSNIRATSSDSSDPLPTPLYNNAILTHFTPQPFIVAALQLKKTSLAFPDALTLLRLWANQRGYTSGTSLCVHGFQDKGFFWASLLGMLINGEDFAVKGSRSTKRKALGGGLSSYQLFRGALDFLGTHDFSKEGVFTKSLQTSKIQPGDFSRAYESVFVDSGTMCNLVADIPLNSLNLLKADARKTLGCLDQQPSAGFDPFSETFLQDLRDLSSRFDSVIRVDLASAKYRDLSAHDALDRGSAAHAFMAALNKILRRGLGNRTTAVAILHPASSPRPLTDIEPTNHRFIHVGLIYDEEHAFRVVDHGPAPDEADADIVEAFRGLWGPKAELRRFQDGRITESVVWDANTVDEKARIPTNVVLFLLGHHFGIDEESCQTWQKDYDTLLRLPPTISKLFTGSSGPLGFGGARQASDALIKLIKGMDEDLPLMVSSISATSESLRSTSPFAPVPMKSPGNFPETGRYQPVLQLVIEFEKSSRWPDDLTAIQTTKLAFLEHAASALLKTGHATIARVCVGDGVTTSDIQDQASLELVTTEGWAFALRISHDRELTLLDRIINYKPIPALAAQGITESAPGNVQEATLAKFVHLQRFVHGPRHHRTIAALCHQYSAYSGTVRLVKRWLASHWLLDSHISPEAVEIICAHLFIVRNKISTARIPQSKERGFAMMIKFFKDWTWEDGLDVPLYDQDATGTAHESQPKAIPYTSPHSAGVWKVSTEFDKQGRMWTLQGPDAIVSRRLKALASAAWDHLKTMATGSLSIATLFQHPVADYDFVIQLQHDAVPRYAQNVAPVEEYLLPKRAGKYANLLKQDDVLHRPGFDPASLFFHDLQRIYKDSILFFFDSFGGDRIGGVWDIKLKQPRPFRVLGGFSSMPSGEGEKDKKGTVALNEAAVLGEIERLGTGIVKIIQARS